MKQLFFSHTWRLDKLNRNTHKRVLSLVNGMKNLGWTTWYDEDDMFGNIDAAMAEGIDNCDCVIICITEEYCNKVNTGAKDLHLRDNCHKEWNYANNRSKLMIPIVMEPAMLNTSFWPPGVVPLHLSSTLYIDGADDDLTITNLLLDKMLKRYKLNPINIPKPILNKKSYMIDKSKSNLQILVHL